MSIRGRTSDDGVREQAHGDLHEAVMSWFESLVPYIAERPGEVKDLWEDAPLWPKTPETDPGLACDHGHAWDPDADDALVADPGDVCPECGAPVEAVELLRYDDAGRQLYEWACGLKRLSTWTNKTVSVEVDGGEWSTESTTIERPQRLKPAVLMRAARYLDIAAEKCGLLEDTEQALATGEL
jgi:hypothetical protein